MRNIISLVVILSTLFTNSCTATQGNLAIRDLEQSIASVCTYCPTAELAVNWIADKFGHDGGTVAVAIPVDGGH